MDEVNVIRRHWAPGAAGSRTFTVDALVGRHTYRATQRLHADDLAKMLDPVALEAQCELRCVEQIKTFARGAA